MRALLAFVVLSAALVLPCAARASTVAGGTTDPVDQNDGIPDIVAVDVAYESDSGTVAATVRFAAPVPADSRYGFQLELARHANGTCWDHSDYIGLLLPRASDAQGAIVRGNWLGRDPLPVAWDATRTVVHLETTNANVAGGRYDCVSVGGFGYEEVKLFWLVPPGVAPPATLAPVRVAIHMTAIPWRCRAKLEILGAHIDGLASGRIRYVISKPGFRRIVTVAARLGQDLSGPHVIRHLRPGHYAVTAQFLGGVDATQEPPQPFTASPVAHKQFWIRAC